MPSKALLGHGDSNDEDEVLISPVPTQPDPVSIKQIVQTAQRSAPGATRFKMPLRKKGVIHAGAVGTARSGGCG